MQVCTSLQADNHASTPNTQVFYRPDALPDSQPTVSKHWRKSTPVSLQKWFNWSWCRLGKEVAYVECCCFCCVYYVIWCKTAESLQRPFGGQLTWALGTLYYVRGVDSITGRDNFMEVLLEIEFGDFTKMGAWHQCSSLLNCLISYYYWGQHLAAEQGMGCFQTKTPEMFYLCCTSNSHMHYLLSMVKTLPSVLWCCWLGSRKGIRPVKNWVVGCWCGCLSGARCRLADSWCHCHSLSLASVKSRLVLSFWYWLIQAVLDKGELNGCMVWRKRRGCRRAVECSTRVDCTTSEFYNLSSSTRSTASSFTMSTCCRSTTATSTTATNTSAICPRRLMKCDTSMWRGNFITPNYWPH